MKYIPTDKLIAEIDKRLSIFEYGIAYSCWESCKKIVESLQQEQPEVDLDNHTIMEEIRKCGCNPNEFDVARHFYELGLIARKEG